MVAKREFREEGHRRKFMAVVDGTEECARAVHYAARRCGAIGNGLALLHVIEPGDFGHWLGVEEIMRAEKREEAEALLARYAELARSHAPDLHVTTAIREGDKMDQVARFIDEDRDVAIMVLAAGEGSDGPGPLVSSIVKSNIFAIPVTVVPATMTDEDIDDLV